MLNDRQKKSDHSPSRRQTLQCERACLRVVILLAAIVLISGCSTVPTCDELAFYETASSGKRIEAPEDLTGLDEFKEMVIPEASPRPPRDLSAGPSSMSMLTPIGWVWLQCSQNMWI
ncbi:protein of unknown function [uncultured Woeseiaceae bacterium]|uniref:Uncharacterized protein n=1 Tax=uncultured Woeseiaceae bacterium TaxID=1983305 RepID=A0A7D9D3A1_9GAMM|nr:protein of unknown function [uncultured Woeseiaceae bacterium]